MSSFGKVLDLLDDRYLELQDVIGNVEPLPNLVPYENYTQNVLVYRMDTNHEIFMGLIQDFTMRRALETRRELWTWLVQWEVDNSPPTQQLSSPKKIRLDTQQSCPSFKALSTPQKAPALTIFERRTLDGALMLEEDMLRILIDIVQVASSLVPNFIEFLYRWVDYYEGDGKALKAALRWEIPSLWDFEYHPLVLPRNEGKSNDDHDGDSMDIHIGKGMRSAVYNTTTELRQSSPTKKMHARPKPDLAALELSASHAEESERLGYREVKFGIQPPKLDQPLPPLINIPRDQRKRTKYYAACFRSRQRALYLLLEAGVTTRQINNYQKMQTTHPRETSEAGDGNGLRNYQKDAKYAQAHFEIKEEKIKQREIAISNKLAVEAQLAVTHAMPDGASGLPLIPPTPSYTRKPDMAIAMMQKINATRARNEGIIGIVPKPLVGKMKSKVFENAKEVSVQRSLGDFWTETGPAHISKWGSLNSSLADTDTEDDENYGDDIEDADEEPDSSSDVMSWTDGGDAVAVPLSAPSLPRPLLPRPLPSHPSASSINATAPQSDTNGMRNQSASQVQPLSATDRFNSSNVATYMQNLNSEQAHSLLALLSPQARQAAASSLRANPLAQSNLQQAPASLVFTSSGQSSHGHSVHPGAPSVLSRLPESVQARQLPIPPPVPVPTLQATPSAVDQPPSLMPTDFNADHFMYLRRQQAASQSSTATGIQAQPTQPVSPGIHPIPQPNTNTPPDLQNQSPAQRQRVLSADFATRNAHTHNANGTQDTINQTNPPASHQVQYAGPHVIGQDRWEPYEPQRFQNPTSNSPSPPTMQLQPQSQALFSFHLSDSSFQATETSDSTIPPPRPGITRSAATPLSISPPKPSPFSTLAPQVMATSPFNTPSTITGIPIQIYLPKILILGNSLRLSGTAMGNNESIETDALLLGHEDAKTGSLILSKAILLPFGVWENTLRKVRSGRWSVVETYACPSCHPANGKGKGKSNAAEDQEAKGCHRAVYDKLVQAYSMMTATPNVREEALTKRWRVSRGPMTSSERGAVWEGWGVVVDQRVEMSAAEREGALRNEIGVFGKDSDGVEDGYGVHDEADEARRRQKEVDDLIDGLMDEDEEMVD